MQETEEQGDDEDIFAKARAVLDNLEISIRNIKYEFHQAE